MKTLFLLLIIALCLLACDSLEMATGPNPDLPKIEGMLVQHNGETLVKVDQSTVTGRLAVAEKGTVTDLKVQFVAKDGSTFQIDAANYAVCCLNTNPQCANLELSNNPDFAHFDLFGNKLGRTVIRFQLLNAQGVIYTSPYIPVSVSSEGKDVEVKGRDEK